MHKIISTNLAETLAEKTLMNNRNKHGLLIIKLASVPSGREL